MLGALRNFVSGWTAKILLILLVGSFAVWGVSGSILGGADTNTVATVGETKVSITDYLNSYSRNINALQQQAGRRLTREEGRIFGVEQQTLGNVISGATLDEFARQQNLALSDETLAKLIADEEAFHDSTGKFNRERFTRAIREARMRESDFIEAQNKTAIRNQVVRAFATDNILPKAFISAMGDFSNEERKFRHVTITPELVGAPPAPTDADLKTYFEANKDTYRAPQFRSLDILAIRPEDIAREGDITDEAARADYDDRKQSYVVPEKRRVQQIVFKSQELADKAVADLAEGAVFETILSDNKVSPADADLGLVTKAQLPAALRDAAFALEPGTPSELLKGPFGPTMVRVTETQEEKTTPFEEVKADIRKDLALRAAADGILGMQESIEDMRAGGSLVAEIADKLGLKLRKVEAIDRTARDPKGNIINDLPESSKLLEQAFGVEEGQQPSPLDFGSAGYIWYDVTKIEQPRDRTQDEVADRLRHDWLKVEQAKLVENKAKEMKERLEKGATLDALAVELGTLSSVTGFFKRAGQLEDFPRTATLAGFNGGANHSAVVDGVKPGEKILLIVEDIKGVEAQLVKVPENEVQIANQGAADDLLTQMVINLQDGYTVTQNQTAINYALTQGR